jgi:AraC-like DNA-binding protein
MSTEQVAERCGYEDESYFCRIFQKHKHITPLRYRKTKAWLKEAEDSSSEPQTPCKKS